MALAHIFYNSTGVQTVIGMQIARFHAQLQGYTVTLTDMAGKNASQMLSAIQAVSAGTMTAVYVAMETQATYSSAGKITYDLMAEVDNCLITASKGTTIVSGACQSNVTATEIILATTASGSDDTYNGKYIRTAGVTAKNRYITDYVGTTKTVTVATTSTAITSTETYVVFSLSSKCYMIGDASSNINSCRVAWTTLFPTKTIPHLVQLMGGSGTIATGLNGVTDGVTTFKPLVEVTVSATSAASTSLTHTSHFTASAYVNKFVGIESGTLGVGQVRQITSNTVSVLTVPAWTTTPTGSIVYCISDTYEYCLGHILLPYAILTYLADATSDVLAQWTKLFDKYGTISKSSTRLDGDLDLLKTYIERGRCIFDAKCKSVVT